MTMPFYVPPEQLIKDRAEFARKGIARGRPIVAVEYTDGVLLIGENPSHSLHKMSEIYDQVAFAGVGRFNEFEMLRVAGIRYADVKGFSYGRHDVTGKGLANAYSQTVGQIFTHEVKPYEIEVLVAEVGDEADADHLYHIQFDGTLHHEHRFATIGGKEDELRQKLEDSFVADLDLNAAIRLGAEAIERVEEHEIAAIDWEAAILDRTRGRRKFRRLAEEDVAAARS
jgi:proteasome alpha subunit